MRKIGIIEVFLIINNLVLIIFAAPTIQETLFDASDYWSKKLQISIIAGLLSGISAMLLIKTIKNKVSG